MARGKIERKFIENRSLRSSTYGRRIRGLKKKTYELATLCDVSAFLVSFGPDGRVETWPESSEEIKDIIHRYASIGGNNVNKLDAEGLLELEVKKQRKELNRVAMDSAGKLQELIKSLDSKVDEVNERMQLLRNQRFTEMLEEQKPTLLDNFKGDGAENYDQNGGFGSTTLEALPALQNDTAVNDDPDIGFWERMANSASLSVVFETDGELFEEENNTDFVSSKDCSEDDPTAGFGSQSELESFSPEQLCENLNSLGFDQVFPQTETMSLRTTFPQNVQAITLDQYMGFSSSLTASSVGGVATQVFIDSCMQSPCEASPCYEHAPVTDEFLPADGIFDDQFTGYDNAQRFFSSGEFGLDNALPVW